MCSQYYKYAVPTLMVNLLFDVFAKMGCSHIDVRDIASVAAVALTQDGHAGKAYEVDLQQFLMPKSRRLFLLLLAEKSTL